MNTPHHTYSEVTPEQVRLLMRAARVERAQSIGRALQRLFRRRREAQTWPASAGLQVLGGAASGARYPRAPGRL